MENVHDLHIWAINSATPLASAHMSIANETEEQNYHDVLNTLHECLHEHFGITHSTPARRAKHEKFYH